MLPWDTMLRPSLDDWWDTEPRPFHPVQMGRVGPRGSPVAGVQGIAAEADPRLLYQKERGDL